MAFPDGVIVLAGGRGRRLGGTDKAALQVGGRTLLQIALAAAAGRPTVVVGPPRELPAGVAAVQEEPAGGGPAAGVAAGYAALRSLPTAPLAARPDGSALIAVLAVDMPGVGPETLARLAAAVRSDPGRPARGAVLTAGGRRQHAVGVFPAATLAAALRRRPSWHDAPLRELLGPLVGMEVAAERGEAGDVDTPDDLRRWRADRDRPDRDRPADPDGAGR